MKKKEKSATAWSKVSENKKKHNMVHKHKNRLQVDERKILYLL